MKVTKDIYIKVKQNRMVTELSKRTINNIKKDGSINLKSDVIKVGHHGSGTSSGNNFLKLVKPKYAIISVGKDNKYGHPHQNILDDYKKLGANIYRTDKCPYKCKE